MIKAPFFLTRTMYQAVIHLPLTSEIRA
jgi:hypothetical protein